MLVHFPRVRGWLRPFGSAPSSLLTQSRCSQSTLEDEGSSSSLFYVQFVVQRKPLFDPLFFLGTIQHDSSCLRARGKGVSLELKAPWPFRLYDTSSVFLFIETQLVSSQRRWTRARQCRPARARPSPPLANERRRASVLRPGGCVRSAAAIVNICQDFLSLSAAAAAASS